MKAILIHPNNKEQLDTLIAIAKALKMKFETTPEGVGPYDTDFVKKIKEGDEDLKNGKFRKTSLLELDSLLK